MSDTALSLAGRKPVLDAYQADDPWRKHNIHWQVENRFLADERADRPARQSQRHTALAQTGLNNNKENLKSRCSGIN